MLTHLENEAAWVAQAQAGNEDAFARLYDQYSGYVYRLALRVTHHRQEAEDVVQDTFLKAFRHLADFRKESRFSTWLTRIAANEALGRLRRRGAQPQVSLDEPMGPVGAEQDHSRLQEIQDQHDDAEATYSKLELQTIVQKVIATLEPVSRTILLMRCGEDFSTELTAKLVGLSVSAVKTRLLRARAKVRKNLGKVARQDSLLPAR